MDIERVLSKDSESGFVTEENFRKVDWDALNISSPRKIS
jgi:hypothetical protein